MEYTVDALAFVAVKVSADSLTEAMSKTMDIQGSGPSDSISEWSVREVDAAYDSQSDQSQPGSLTHLLEAAHSALKALEQAADGDSNDIEIQAGHEVADHLRRLISVVTGGG